MESLLLRPTPPLLSCKLPRRHHSTSTNCRVNKCNSGCRTATRGMAHQLSIIQYTKPNLSYLLNEIDRGRIVWGPLLDSTRECFLVRAHIHHNNYRTQPIRGQSTAINHSKHPLHINTFSNRAALLACHRSFKTNISTPEVAHSACRQRHHLPSHRQPTILVHKGHLPNLSVEAVSIHPRTEVNHMCKAYHTVVAPAKHSAPQSYPTAMVQLRRNMAKAFKPSSHNKECTICEPGSCSNQIILLLKEPRWGC